MDVYLLIVLNQNFRENLRCEVQLSYHLEVFPILVKKQVATRRDASVFSIKVSQLSMFYLPIGAIYAELLSIGTIFPYP